MSFGFDSSFDWTSIMNAELTAENSPACTRPDSVLSTEIGNQTTDEDEGRVQVLVVLFRVISIELSGFPAVHCEEVCPGVIGPQRVEEFFEGGMQAGMGVSNGWLSREPNGPGAPLRIYLNDRWLSHPSVFS